MSQPGSSTWSNSDHPALAETQAMNPTSQFQWPAMEPGPARSAVEIRSTALYYATRVIGDQGTISPDAKMATTLRVAKSLEAYLLTGKI